MTAERNVVRKIYGSCFFVVFANGVPVSRNTREMHPTLWLVVGIWLCG